MDICIVDDSPVVTAQVRRMLAAASLGNAVVFNHADAAFQWCLSHSPPIVLLDYSMPGVDGLEFLRRLKSNPATSGAAVALMTGWETETLRRRATQDGAVGLIAKPFSEEEFRAFVLTLKGAALEAAAPSEDDSPGLVPGPAASAAERNTLDLSRVVHEWAVLNPVALVADHVLLRKVVLSLAQAQGASPMELGLLDAALRRTLRLLPSRRRVAALGSLSQDECPPEFADKRALLARKALQLLSSRDGDALKMCAQMVVFWQERWDGTGKPLGARGLAVPMAARLLSVANRFASLVSPDLGADRPVPIKLMLDVIEAGAGKEFDPAMVRALRGVASAVVLEN